jgi:hypothetical protein
MTEIIERLKEAYPKMFINEINEAIIEPCNNIYFRLEDVKDEKDVMIKLVKWCSRLKEMTKVRKYYLLNGFNNFCGTNFTLLDMDHIYCQLGNDCKPELTKRFVDSDFNMDLLPKYEIPSWFKGDIRAWEKLLEKR